VANLQLKLKGRKAMVRCRAGTECDCDRSIAYGAGSRVDRPMRKGCATFGVNKWSDVCVYERWQSAETRNARECGEWENRVMDRKTGSEWVMKVKERVLVETCAEGRAKGS
jgi:hypothetical protein